MHELINIEPIDAGNILRRSEEIGESEMALIEKLLETKYQRPNTQLIIETDMIEPIIMY